MAEPPHIGAKFLEAMFGPSTTHPVFICSLLNAEARSSEQVNERFVTTRRVDDISGFVRKWDRAGRGLYFCVSTLQPNVRRRSKSTVSELNCLFVDLDFKDVEEPPDDVRGVMANKLMCPPAFVINSGHGLHLYWPFREAIAATSETMADVEQLLQRLADLLGADPAATDCSRLLRLPGTHNTKNGEQIEVTIEVSRPDLRYELDDLRDWLELAPQPLLRRRERAGNGQSPDDPFLATARRQGFKPPVDVEARLAAMQYQGAGDCGIHFTQLAVSASLLNHGTSIDDVVTMLLDATRAAAGEAGQRWNWIREERELRGMCEDWLEKHPEIVAPGPGGGLEPGDPQPGDPQPGDAHPGDAQPGGGGPRPGGPQPGGPQPGGPQPGARKAGKRKYGETALIIADGVIDAIRRGGDDLLLTGGDLHFYHGGLWSPVDTTIEQRLRVLIQQGADTLREADTRVLSAAWKRLHEHPALYRAHVDWDAAGKVGLTRRKGKRAVRVGLAIPVVLTANALPAARDASDAVFNRSLVLDMTRVFDETNAIDARRKFGVPPGRWLGDWLFEQEGSGFLNWALEGLARLLKQGAFVIPECVLTAIQNFQREGDIVVDFARTVLERSGSTRIARGDVVCAFHGWRRDDEGDKARLYGGRWLIPRLRTACPWIFHRTSNGVRYLCGAKLTGEGLKHWARQATVASQGGRGAEGESTNKDEVNRPWDVHASG